MNYYRNKKIIIAEQWTGEPDESLANHDTNCFWCGKKNNLHGYLKENSEFYSQIICPESYLIYNKQFHLVEIMPKKQFEEEFEPVVDLTLDTLIFWYGDKKFVNKDIFLKEHKNIQEKQWFEVIVIDNVTRSIEIKNSNQTILFVGINMFLVDKESGEILEYLT